MMTRLTSIAAMVALLTSCIGPPAEAFKEAVRLTEFEVPYADKSHSECLKILDDFAQQTGLQVVDTKYYQRGEGEFAVSVLSTEQFEGKTVYSGASCVIDAARETILYVRGPTFQKVAFGQLRRWQ